MKSAVVIALALALSACGVNQRIVKTPPSPAQAAKTSAIEKAKCTPVVVTKEVQRPLKFEKKDIPNLTAACANSTAREQSSQEAKRLALFRNDALIECSKRMAKIAEILTGLFEDSK